MNKPYMTKRHLVLEILSYVLLLVCFIIAIVGMATLPDEIPTHFTMSGEIDGYGSPGTLLILPIIMLICNGMTSLIMHVMPPTMWNTPSKLKPQNAVRALQDMISRSHGWSWRSAYLPCFSRSAFTVEKMRAGLLLFYLWER